LLVAGSLVVHVIDALVDAMPVADTLEITGAVLSRTGGVVVPLKIL